MKKFILTALCASFLATPASADSSTEIVSLFNQYKDSLGVSDYSTAAENALKAWKTAELTLGDHPTTGVLAQNYANLNWLADLDHFAVVAAYTRSIELAETVEMREYALDKLVQYAQGVENKRLKNKLYRTIKANYVERYIDDGMSRTRHNRP